MDEQLQKVISENLRYLRKEKGFSQSELGEKAKLSTEFISRVERGASFPSLKTLKRMADALNVKMGIFFDDPDDMDSWEMEIEAIIILLKSKRGKSIRKIYKLGEVLGE